MKNLTFRIALGLIMFLLLANGTVLANGKSSTLMVSCTIPAIPGVNAPPFDLDEITPQEDQTDAEEAKPKEEENSSKNNASYSVIVDRTVTSDKIIKTVYNK